MKPTAYFQLDDSEYGFTEDTAIIIFGSNSLLMKITGTSVILNPFVGRKFHSI